MNIVVTMEVQDKHKEILTKAVGTNTIIFNEDVQSDSAKQVLKDADIIIGKAMSQQTVDK